MSKAALLVLVAAAAFSTCLPAQQAGWPPAAAGHLTLPVWPVAPPGALANPSPEIDTTTAKDNLIAGRPLVRLGNVSVPTITFYPPHALGGPAPADKDKKASDSNSNAPASDNHDIE